jgi:hypothetical protein
MFDAPSDKQDRPKTAARRKDPPPPGVDAPIQNAVAIRSGDEGAVATPIESEDSLAAGDRAADADQPE